MKKNLDRVQPWSVVDPIPLGSLIRRSFQPPLREGAVSLGKIETAVLMAQEGRGKKLPKRAAARIRVGASPRLKVKSSREKALVK